jgi:PKHD-type hydroxylase
MLPALVMSGSFMAPPNWDGARLHSTSAARYRLPPLRASLSGVAPIFHDCEQAFSGEECDRLVALADAAEMKPGSVYGGGDYLPDPAVRRVDTSFHPRGPATAWIYDRLDGLFAEAAAALGVSVAPMREDIQLMRYGLGSHFRLWHSDAGYDRQRERLISVSVELSNAADYEGGVLEIATAAMGARSLPRGGARFFPSRALHRVTPVTRGTRYSLVNWTGSA